MAVEYGGQVLCIEKEDNHRPFSVTPDIEVTTSVLHCTLMGKCLLAFSGKKGNRNWWKK